MGSEICDWVQSKKNDDLRSGRTGRSLLKRGQRRAQWQLEKAPYRRPAGRKILRLAEEQGYTVNQQASLLRRRKSTMIGMIVPKYDNRYFGSIVELFESMARERGLFPVITCTSRDPELEIEAARTMLSYQVDWIISTGATAPTISPRSAPPPVFQR